MAKKRGAFHKDEIEFIKSHHTSMTVEQMAEALNRGVDVVREQLYKIEGSYKTKEEVKKFERELKTRPYWNNLKKQYSEDELELYQYHWIKYTQQFEDDITHAEESQILKAIDLEMMLERTKLERNQIEKTIVDLEENLDYELSKENDDQDKNLIINIKQQILAARAAISSGYTTFNNLLDKHQKLMRDLKSTRDQRFKEIETKDVTFFGWLKKFEDQKTRERVSRDAELMKLAIGKQRKELGEYHKYEDGEVDRPLLNDETVILDEESQDVSGIQGITTESQESNS